MIGLARNVKDFVFTGYEGLEVKRSEIQTHDGVPIGYAGSPKEAINYVSVGDQYCGTVAL